MSSLSCDCTGNAEGAICRRLLEIDEGPLRRRAAETLWMAHFRGRDVRWLDHLPASSMPLIRKLVHRLNCESLELDIMKFSQLDGYLIAGFVSVAPMAELSCASNGRLRSLYTELCDASLSVLPRDSCALLMSIECCLLRALKKRPEDLNSFRQYLCSQSASEKLRSVVRCCWDSEFAGVADLSVRIFELWLEANFSVNEREASAVCHRLLRHYLCRYPWFYRGKYRVIASLMNRCTPDEIIEVRDQFYGCWKASMNCAHVAPLASKLWRIALNRCSDRLELWLPIMGQLLLDQGQKTCALIGRHWLPTVKHVAHYSFQGLIDACRSRIAELKRRWTPSVELGLLSNLHDTVGSDQDARPTLDQPYKAVSILLKQYFNIGQWQGDRLEANWGLLEEVGICADESARIGYFEVLCRHSPKKAMSNSWHRDRVHQFLLTNLTVPSQSFRLSMMSSYRHYLLKMERTDSLRAEWLRYFMDAILSQLFPGANFQRYLSSLSLLLVALESCSRFKALWDERFEKDAVWRTQSRSILMRCLLHSCADIREIAVRIATEFCSYETVIGTEDVKLYMQVAFDLIGRPELSECDVGASFLVFLLSSAGKFQGKVNVGNSCDAEAIRVDILSNLIFPTLSTLREETDNGAIPCVFGRLRACSLLWPIIQGTLPTSFVLQLISAIVNLILEILHRLGSNEKSDCPTLPEMHSSIGIHLAENETLLPLALKAVLWNVTEGCGLLVRCADRLIEERRHAELHSIRDLFFEVMTRNRSVIIHDECEKHLISFCTLCLKARWETANSVVMELTERTLSNIEFSPPVSAPRRAGGYPFLLKCLVCTTSTFGERRMLSCTLERLMQICLGALDNLNLGGPTEDSALLRALHCLRIIVLSSECHEGCRPFLAELFRLALIHLTSPYWSVRNAVSMLLAAIVRALFARSSIQKGTVGDPWAQDVFQFWSCHGDIWQQCVQLTVKVADSIREHPFDARIHPLLIFFQNLAVDDAPVAHVRVKEDLRQCTSALAIILVHSPEWSVRRLAAQALSNLTPPRQRQLAARRIQSLLRSVRMASNLRDAAAKLIEALRLPLTGSSDENTPNSIGRQADISELCRLVVSGVNVDLSVPHLRERLVECCAGARGSSMQALALPVLTKLMMLSQNDIFVEWTGFVTRFAADGTNERLRYAAAVSLALAGNLVLDFAQHGECHADLLMAVCGLLQDDIDHVRNAVSQISVFFNHNLGVPLECSQCMPAMLDCMVGQEAAIALVGRLLDELLPDVSYTFPAEGSSVKPTDCIHYAEKYTTLLTYYEFLDKFASLHPVGFDRLLSSKLAVDRRSYLVVMDRLHEDVERFFEDNFSMSSLKLTSGLFEMIVRLCLTRRLLTVCSDSNGSLDRILPAMDWLHFLACAKREPDF